MVIITNMEKDIFQLKISIQGSRKPFYRRISIASDLAFIDLHDTIQILMDWSDVYLFLFKSGASIITDPLQWEEDEYPEAYDAFETRLDELLQVGSELEYRYFAQAADWTFLIEVEGKVSDTAHPENPQNQSPHCFEAVGGMIPEDCDNIENYYRILNIFNDSEQEEHEDIKEWLGDDFDPDFFDMEASNEALKEIGEEVSFFDLLNNENSEGSDLLRFDQLMEGPHLASNELQLESARQQFEQYKALGEKAMAQVPDEGLFWQFNDDSNSIAIIVKHLWGNMLSRWTDFLTTDGEKEWRARDSEFEPTFKTRNELMDKWELGWDSLFEALDELSGENWDNTVYIRKQPHLVWQAVNRQIAHYAYHVGQIVFLSKMLARGWESLSIPKGKSKEFNTEMNK